MCNVENLKERKVKANACAIFAKIMQQDGKLVKSVLLPGSDGKQYQVIIRREKTFTGNPSVTKKGLFTELLLVVNDSIINPPHGAQITYHQMAAVQVAAKEQGYTVTWFADETRARKWANFGGSVFHVTNFNNPHNVLWGVMSKEK